VPFLLAERARSEGARSTCAVRGSLGHSPIEDLADQLFNSSGNRLAHVLRRMAQFGKEGKPETVISKIIACLTNVAKVSNVDQSLSI